MTLGYLLNLFKDEFKRGKLLFDRRARFLLDNKRHRILVCSLHYAFCAALQTALKVSAVFDIFTFLHDIFSCLFLIFIAIFLAFTHK